MSGKSKKSTKKASKKTPKKASTKKTAAKKVTLSDIPGVGAKTAESLREGGFKTVASLAKTEPAKLMKKVEGIGEVMATRIIEEAKRLVEKGPSERAAKKKKVAKKKKSPAKKKVKAKESPELDELAKELASDDEQLLLGVIDRLGMLDDPKATEQLIACLKHTRYMVRIHAAAQLGERKDKSAIEPLINALQDESLFVRQTAAGALENIGGTKARKAVTAAESEGLLLDELPEGRRLEQK
jgi:NAD-dependent DNA ligase